MPPCFHRFLLILLLGLAAAPAPAGASEARADGHAVQDLLPLLAARAESARQRARDARAFFEGRIDLERAFPMVDPGRLGDPGYLVASRLELDAAAARRAAERTAPSEATLSSLLSARYSRALQVACDAEDEADMLLRRLLSSIEAGLRAAPELQDAAVEARVETWTLHWRDLPAAPPPDREAVVRAALGAVGRLRDIRRASWRAMAIPGDPSLLERVEAELDERPAPDLSQPEDILQAEAREDRLRRVLPLLGPKQAARVTATLEESEKARLEAALATLERKVPPALPSEAAALHTAFAQAQAEVSEARAGLDALPDTPDSAIIALRHRLLEARLRAGSEHAERLRVRIEALEKEPSEEAMRESMADARSAAEQAREAAAADEDGLRSALKARLAALHEQKAEVLARSLLEGSSEAGPLELAERVETLSERLDASLALPPLDRDRQRALDQAYTDAWVLLIEARTLLDAERLELRDLRSVRVGARKERGPSANALANVGVGDELRRLVAEVDEATEDLRLTLTQREDAHRARRDEILRHLDRIKALRRAARPEASTEALDVLRRNFIVDLGREVVEIPLWVRSLGIRSLQGLRASPARIMDLGVLAGLARGSAELLFTAFLWWILRGRARALSERLATMGLPLTRGRWGWARAFLERLRDLFSRSADRGVAVSQASVDLLGSLLLWRLLDRNLPFISVLMLGAALVFAARLPEPILELTWPDTRPAGPAEPRDKRLLAKRSLLGFILWCFVPSLAIIVSVRFLNADRIADLFALSWDVAGVLLLILALGLWRQPIQTAVGAEEPEARPIRWAAGEGRWWLGPFASALALGWLVVQKARSLLEPLVLRRSWYSAMERILGRTASLVVEGPEPGPDQIAAIAAALPIPSAYADAAEGLSHARNDWLKKRRRGVAVLTGRTRGARRRVLDAYCARNSSPPLLRVEMHDAIGDSDALLRWLETAVGLESPTRCTSFEELGNRLEAMETRVFVIENVHRLFLRSVGGFEGVRHLLELLHRTSEEHFWVISIHEPTWEYLRCVPVAMDLGVVQYTIRVEPMSGEALERWFTSGFQATGLELSFRALGGVTPDTSAGEAERRARSESRTWWRWLAEASAGEPLIARRLVERSLRVGATPGRLEATSIPEASLESVRALRDEDLFLLASIHIHGDILHDRLAATMNLSEAQVETSCLRLQARRMLAFDAERHSFSIRGRWLAAVTTRLRERRLLYFG